MKLLLPVAAPFDAVDDDGFRQFQLDPASAGLVGNPTVTVAVAAVVDVGQLVEGVGTVVSRTGGLGALTGESHVASGATGPSRGVDFQFVEARFTAIGVADGETDKPGSDRSKSLDVAAGVDRWPELVDQSGELALLVFQLVAELGNLRVRDGQGQRAVGMADSREHGSQGVVVDLGHRVKLVVMTTCTTQRETQEGGAGSVDHVGQFVLALGQGQ